MAGGGKSKKNKGKADVAPSTAAPAAPAAATGAQEQHRQRQEVVQFGPESASPVKGFRLLRLPVAPGSLISRALLVKRHEGRTPEEKECAERTLFVTHLDSFVSEAQLKRCFADGFGAVERIEYKAVEKKPQKADLKTDKVLLHVIYARIIFKESISLKKALAAATGHVAPSVLPSLGSELKETLKDQRSLYKDPAALRKEVDTFMANWDQRKEQQARDARENAVDEDGFTKVVSGVNRSSDGLVIRAARKMSLPTGAFAEPINGGDAIKDPEAEAAERKGSGTRLRKRKKTKMEHPDFYRFQQREAKMKELAEYRKRKIEDKEKVEEVRHLKKKPKVKKIP